MAEDGEWSHGLFGCFDDIGTCLCAFICSPCQFHTNAGRVGVPCGCCLWHIPFVNFCCCAHVRGKVRQRSRIPGNFLVDFALHCLCHECALTQEGQELDRVIVPNVAAPVAVNVNVVNVSQTTSQPVQQPAVMQQPVQQPVFMQQPVQQPVFMQQPQPGYPGQAPPPYYTGQPQPQPQIPTAPVIQ